MGINSEAAAFLGEARRSGVSFGRVLTLGRLNLNADRRALTAIAASLGRDASLADDSAGEYSEKYLRLMLGADEVASIDNSDYEGASFTHDLNVPVPASLEQRFDAVIDGGTLEHVFNFPAALASCMRMVATGGRLFIFTPANNHLGHGFYQFSPELFFRSLGADRGFEIERMEAVQHRYAGTEYGSLGPRYGVADPARVGSRVTLVNARPVTLMVQARKVAHVDDPFAAFPQQSDYTEMWSHGKVDRPVQGPSAARRVAQLLPPGVKLRLRNEFERRFVHSFRNKTFYKPLSE